jgi:hypothetical protein
VQSCLAAQLAKNRRCKNLLKGLPAQLAKNRLQAHADTAAHKKQTNTQPINANPTNYCTNLNRKALSRRAVGAQGEAPLRVDMQVVRMIA